jgi:hypothetical protein
MVAATSRASAGARPNSSRKSSTATSVRIRARSSRDAGGVVAQPALHVDGRDPLRDPKAELRDVVGVTA